jgi:large subunit ribosomal protein L25
MHLEFQALSATEKVSIEIPLVFVNEDKCDGIKKGGELIVNMKTVRVRCLPDSIPEKIEVDLQSLTLETVLHLSQLSWPNGVESQDLNLGSEHDLPVLAIHAVKSVSESSADGESQ